MSNVKLDNSHRFCDTWYSWDSKFKLDCQIKVTLIRTIKRQKWELTKAD